MNDPLVHRLILLSCVLFSSPTFAEQMFVTDKLVLNVYAEPDQESERIATLETGDTVEVLEHGENFLRVQLPDEREGWVGASYLTTEAPALVRARTLEKEHKTATQALQKQHTEQLAQLKTQNTELKTLVETLQETAAAPKPVPEVNEETPVPLAREAVHDERSADRIWMWVLLLILLAAALGYLAGYQTLARRIRNKFGGVKIY